MEIQQYYEILELDRGATKSEVKQAYRELVSVWHPDRFSDNSRLRYKAEGKLREFNEAYERVLSFLSSEAPVVSVPDLEPEPEPEPEETVIDKRIITVSSGKGGVGKTNFALNAAIAMSRLKEKVMILDADLGMANIDVLCGLTPRFNLGDVVRRAKSIEEVVVEVFDGIKIVPGISGVEDLTSLNIDQQMYFFEELSRYEKDDDTDLVLIDIGAGMNPTVIDFMLACNENIVITSPEPTSMMDAYALIKTVVRKSPDTYIHIVVNMARSRDEAERVFSSMNRISEKFLKKELNYLGHIVFDKAVPAAVKRQQPWFMTEPGGRAGKCVREIALRILNREDEIERQGGIRSFFKRMSSLLSSRAE